MKKAFKPALFVLLMYGVFGADEDEVKSVSVMEGDSVTLPTDLTQIKGFNLIEWWFKDQLIASFDRSKTKYPNERFGDRLKLNQTGSLTITNMRTKHSGLYKLQIELNSGTVYVDFTVTVYESPSVIDAGKAEMKSVSVTSGDPVTLQTGVTQISGDEMIVWRFGDEGKLIAKADIEAKSSPLYDTDGRFRDRLELDQTGSLTITDTRSTDSGFYSVKISSRTQTVYKRFSVSVSGLSPGGKAGIVVAVLLVLAAAAAAAAAGFIYQRRKISEQQKQIWRSVFVTAGQSVRLPTDHPKIERGDVIQWMFGDEIIAEVKEGTGKTHYVPDGRFRDRLQLDDQTGDLTIKNFTYEDEGDYKLKIISSKGNTDKTYRVTITVELVYVTAGESVRLSTGRPKIERDNEIQWRFGDEIIAEVKEGTGKTHDGPYEQFRDRLQLNDQTGDLTIKTSTDEDTGRYNLKIISRKGDTNRAYLVIITLRHVSVTAGESVRLSTDRPEIERDDEIQWRFRDEIIAEIKGGAGETHDGAAGRFRDRLQLNDQTGDLTIKSCTAEHAGCYNLKIRSSKGDTNKTYRVIITVRIVFVTAGESVHLSTGRPKIERDDVIQWRCGDEIIAEIKEGTGKTHDGADGRFRDRLELNNQTGDLTIKSSTDEDEGYYNLKIRNSKGNTNRTYSVIIRGRSVFVTEGESVRLFTDHPEIERGDEIQWRFRDEIIAEVKGGTEKTHDGADGRFRDRLQLNDQTGDLTIKSCTAKDDGRYKLKIRSSKGNRNKTYRVTITWREESPVKGNNDESVVEMQPLMIK